MTTASLVYITVPDTETARTLAHEILKKRLAACANILPAMQSLYWWDGAVQEDCESLLLLKTTAERFQDVKACVLAHHPYDCPCITQLPITDGHPDFLRWITEQTASLSSQG